MRVVAHINIPEGGLEVRTYHNVGHDPQFGAAGVLLRNANGGVIAMLPWHSLAALELPENDTSIVAVGATGGALITG